MAIGDRPARGVYQTGTENGCSWGSDGYLYNANGYRIESLAEKKARLRKEQEAYDARQKPPGYSYERIVGSGLDDIGSNIEKAVFNTNTNVAKGLKNVGIFGLILALVGVTGVGVATYSSEMKKNPGDTAKAKSKAFKNALMVLGIMALTTITAIIWLFIIIVMAIYFIMVWGVM